MSKREKLLDKARINPAGLRYEEVCQLAEAFGFEFDRQSGSSHAIYKLKGFKRLMNFQNVGGYAKKYQVKQLLDALTELGLIDD